MFHVKQWNKKDLDRMLRAVIDEAKAIGIPVSPRISPSVEINTRAAARFGCCRKTPALTGAVYRIEVSKPVLNAEESILRSILAHEVLHACPGCQNHKDRWQSYGKAMEAAYGYRIRRTWTYEGMGLEDPRKVRAFRFRLRCEGCGAEILRKKRSPLVDEPHRYRCRCGGKLRLECLAEPQGEERRRT